MKRREFITLLGGAAAAWPLAARAQQPAMPVVGFLYSVSPDTVADRLRGISPRPEGDRLRRGRQRGDRVSLGRQSNRSTAGAGRRTGSPTGRGDRRRKFPFGVRGQGGDYDNPDRLRRNEDPVTLGLVASLARPGGNVTGINFLQAELTAKRLELCVELVPTIARVAVLNNPANVSNTASMLRDVEAAAGVLAMQIQFFNASTNREIDAAVRNPCEPAVRRRLRRPRRILQQPASPTDRRWRRATHFPWPIRGVNLSRPAG